MDNRRNLLVVKLYNLHLVGTKVAVATTETFVVRSLNWSATGVGRFNTMTKCHKVRNG